MDIPALSTDKLKTGSRVAVFPVQNCGYLQPGTVRKIINAYLIQVTLDAGPIKDINCDHVKIIPTSFIKKPTFDSKVDKDALKNMSSNNSLINKKKPNILLGYDYVDTDKSDLQNSWESAISRKSSKRPEKKIELASSLAKPLTVVPALPSKQEVIKQEENQGRVLEQESVKKPKIKSEKPTSTKTIASESNEEIKKVVKDTLNSIVHEVTAEEKLRQSLIFGALKKWSPTKGGTIKPTKIKVKKKKKLKDGERTSSIESSGSDDVTQELLSICKESNINTPNKNCLSETERIAWQQRRPSIQPPTSTVTSQLPTNTTSLLPVVKSEQSSSVITSVSKETSVDTTNNIKVEDSKDNMKDERTLDDIVRATIAASQDKDKTSEISDCETPKVEAPSGEKYANKEVDLEENKLDVPTASKDQSVVEQSQEHKKTDGSENITAMLDTESSEDSNIAKLEQEELVLVDNKNNETIDSSKTNEDILEEGDDKEDIGKSEDIPKEDGERLLESTNLDDKNDGVNSIDIKTSESIDTKEEMDVCIEPESTESNDKITNDIFESKPDQVDETVCEDQPQIDVLKSKPEQGDVTENNDQTKNDIFESKSEEDDVTEGNNQNKNDVFEFKPEQDDVNECKDKTKNDVLESKSEKDDVIEGNNQNKNDFFVSKAEQETESKQVNVVDKENMDALDDVLSVLKKQESESSTISKINNAVSEDEKVKEPTEELKDSKEDIKSDISNVSQDAHERNQEIKDIQDALESSDSIEEKVECINVKESKDYIENQEPPKDEENATEVLVNGVMEDESELDLSENNPIKNLTKTNLPNSPLKDISTIEEKTDIVDEKKADFEETKDVLAEKPKFEMKEDFVGKKEICEIEKKDLSSEEIEKVTESKPPKKETKAKTKRKKSALEQLLDKKSNLEKMNKKESKKDLVSKKEDDIKEIKAADVETSSKPELIKKNQNTANNNKSEKKIVVKADKAIAKKDDDIEIIDEKIVTKASLAKQSLMKRIKEMKIKKAQKEKDVEIVEEKLIKKEDSAEKVPLNKLEKDTENKTPSKKEVVDKKSPTIKGKDVKKSEENNIKKKTQKKKETGQKPGHTDTNTFYYRDPAFPDRWFIKVAIRTCGNKADSYYYTPCRTLLRSYLQIEKFLKGDMPSKPSKKVFTINFQDMPLKQELCENDLKFTHTFKTDFFEKLMEKSVLTNGLSKDTTVVEKESIDAPVKKQENVSNDKSVKK